MIPAGIDTAEARDPLLSRAWIVALLKSELPDADAKHLEEFADAATDGLARARLRAVLVNLFASTIVPFRPLED